MLHLFLLFESIPLGLDRGLGVRFTWWVSKLIEGKKRMQTNVVREMNKPFEVIALHRMWWIELKMNPHQNRHRPGVIRILCFFFSLSLSFQMVSVRSVKNWTHIQIYIIQIFFDLLKIANHHFERNRNSCTYLNLVLRWSVAYI